MLGRAVTVENVAPGLEAYEPCFTVWLLPNAEEGKIVADLHRDLSITLTVLQGEALRVIFEDHSVVRIDLLFVKEVSTTVERVLL